MPRPRKARPTAATTTSQPPEPDHPSDTEAQLRRGRSRATRSAFKLSAGEQHVIHTATRSRDAALDRLATEDVTTSGDPAEDASSVEMGRNAMETPAGRRDTTGLDLGDSMFGDLEDSFEGGNIPSALRSGNTSSLTMSNFRARSRSRQSSIIGRNDPPIRPSSRGTTTPNISSTINIGLFKRRAREPSILGTTRKTRTAVPGNGHNSELESEADFAPDAESTPAEKRQSRAAVDRARTSPTQQAEERSRPMTRKRKSDEVYQSERAQKASRLSPQTEPERDSDSELSSLDSPQLPPVRHSDRPATPVNLEDSIAAPPESSDSEDQGDFWPDIHGLAKKRRRPSFTAPQPVDAVSDISSPPSLTHSPNYTAPKNQRRNKNTAATQKPRSPVFSTAELASLLPKRRYKKDRNLHLDSEDESGEDAEHHSNSRDKRRHQRSKRSTDAASALPRSRTAPQRETTTLKEKQPTRATRSSSRHQTYSSRRSSDKENESGEDDAEDESMFQALPDDSFNAGSDAIEDGRAAALPDELKNAAKKFKEVDQWNLEYEEVQRTSSPVGAR